MKIQQSGSTKTKIQQSGSTESLESFAGARARARVASFPGRAG